MYHALTCQYELCSKGFRCRDERQKYCSQRCGAQASAARKMTDAMIAEYMKLRIHKLPGAGSCWEWQGFRTVNGYGRAFVRGKIYAAHVFVYEMLKSPVPEGMTLVRTCLSKFCINPAHYRLEVPDSVQALREFFLERIDQSVGKTACWIWKGGQDISRYGRIRLRKSRQRLFAHRVAFELFVGPIPAGMDILHRCNVPACVNPHHLYPGTQVENGHDRAVAQVMHRTPGITDDMVLAMRRLRHDTGMTFEDIGQQFGGIPHATVRALCRGVTFKHLDMTYVDRSPQRPMSSHRKLSQDDYARIVQLRTIHGMTYRAIGALYGVSGTRIMNICRMEESKGAPA